MQGLSGSPQECFHSMKPRSVSYTPDVWMKGTQLFFGNAEASKVLVALHRQPNPMLQRSYWLQGLVPGALVLKQSLGTTQDSIRLQKPAPCQKVLLIIKPLSAVQELSWRPGLVLSSSINAARLAPPNNSGSWSPPPSQAVTLFTLDDGHCEKGTSTPSSALRGTGLGRTWMHKPRRATTTAILCNLLGIPAGAIHLTKMFD